VDVVAFTVRAGRLEVLVVRIAQGPLAGRWAFPGGFVRLDESPDAAAVRELREHTGLRDVHLEQLYTFGGPHRDPSARVVSVAYLGLSRTAAGTVRPRGKYVAVSWVSVNRLPRLAYDHGRVGRMALARLRAKLEYTNIVRNLLPDAFTLGELQETYEAILGRPLDRRNFRRKLLALKLLARRPGTRRGAHRPAALYGFRHRTPMNISIL
jgi:8-oxo-dGTP diphosphatase